MTVFSFQWTPVGMHQLVDAGDVRKHYLKACLAVHPDKVSSLFRETCNSNYLSIN